MSAWQRIELTFKSQDKKHRFRCASCDARLRVTPSATARQFGRVVPVIVFLGFILPQFFGYEIYWSYLILGMVGVSLLAIAFRSELTFELDDLPESPAMNQIEEMDEEGW